MNTKNLAIASTVGVVALVAMLFAFPAMAASSTAPQNMNAQQIFQHYQSASLQRVDLKVGQNITIDSVAGGYQQVGKSADNGTATGSLTLQVSGALSRGFILSTTGGSLNSSALWVSVLQRRMAISGTLKR